jgi:hypothetical protein
MTSGEAAQTQRYGRGVLDDGLETIEAHNERIDEMVTDEDIKECLEQLDMLDELPAYQERIGKALSDLRADVGRGRVNQGQVQRRMDALQDTIAELYREERSNRKDVVTLAKSFDKLCVGLASLAERQPSKHDGLAQLTKALLPAGTPLAEQVRAAQLLKSWYGASGGREVAYSADLYSKLRLTKSITSEQEGRWKRTGRLPDWVNVADPTQNAPVEWQTDAQKRTGTLLSQVSPLYLAGLALGRRG